jgi:hypothetical protein
MGLTLREERDEDLPLLFEQWADPVAAQMAAFTAPDHMDRDAFERREALGRDVMVDSSATAQPRLWLTTSTLCPSGSSTNAP